MNNRKKRVIVVHVITGLRYGGAEMMLFKLLSQTNTQKIHPIVVSLTGYGSMGCKLRDLGVEVLALNINPALPSPIKVFRLWLLLRRLKPMIVQTWMYHSDLIGGVVARLAGARHVIWNIRNSGLSAAHNKLHTRFAVKLCSWFSHVVPSVILTNSNVAVATHTEKGYKKDIFRVIPNGFDASIYKPDICARVAIRSELGLDEGAKLIGLIARYNPQKDHPGFLKAASILNSRRDHVFYVLVGTEVDESNAELRDHISEYGLGECTFLMGQRDDIPQILASLDICALSSSYGEAFPNVLGEAMCCEVPVVTTDVGDSVLIVGDTGIVVEPEQAEPMADAWFTLLGMTMEERKSIGKRGRQRIITNFDLAKVASMYEKLYLEL